MASLLRALGVSGLCCLVAVAAAGCSKGEPQADRSAGPASHYYLAQVSNVALTAQRPAHFVFHVDHGRTVRIAVSATEPLLRHTLLHVTSPPESSPQGDPIPTQGSGHTSGGTTVDYALLTTAPLAPGWYRVELVGRGRLLYLGINEQ